MREEAGGLLGIRGDGCGGGGREVMGVIQGEGWECEVI